MVKVVGADEVVEVGLELCLTSAPMEPMNSIA